MSVFGCEDRILLEEIVEAAEEQETNLCGSIGSAEEGSVTSATVAEIADSQEQQRQQQQQSKSNGAVSRRVVGQNVALSNGNGTSNVGRVTPRSHMEQEKRMRREIANSNERRRMQSINAGFQSLRTLLPHHEGEKLSKAAILQQTAEYIYQLEQEKTQLLSQNCQLKRLVNQHEGGDVPIKKRKPDNQGGVVVSLPMHVSESGDEGLGSMSPEPLSVITVTTEGHSVVNSEVVDLRRQLERERHARLHLEKQMRAIESQLYPERFRDNQLITYQPHEVIEHTDNVIAQETEEAVAALQVVSVVSLPPVGSTQTVETSSPDPSSPPLSPQPADMEVPEDIKEEDMGPDSPKIVAFTQSQTFAAIEEQTTADSFSSSSRVTYTGDFKGSSPQYITASPSRPFSPVTEPQRLPSVLEAAIKAEPKVEVERLPSPSNTLDDGSPQSRLYLANTSRQNLETIVEAIRHLEGDHLFSDEPTGVQDAPLALTNKQTANNASCKSSTTPSVTASASASASTSASATASASSLASASASASPSVSASASTSTSATTSVSASTSALALATSSVSASVSASVSPSAPLSGSATATASTSPTFAKQRLMQAEFLQFHRQQQQTQQRPGVIVVKHS